jgi:hypothetical protein
MVFDIEPELGFVNDFVEGLFVNLSVVLSIRWRKIRGTKFIDSDKLRILSPSRLILRVNPHSACLVNLLPLPSTTCVASLNGPLHKKSFVPSCKLLAMKLVVTCFLWPRFTLHHSWEHDSPHWSCSKPPYIDVSKKSNASTTCSIHS